MSEDQFVDIPQPLGLFAGDLYRRGLEYLDAFEALTQNGNGKFLFASYFLFAHAFEILLKSFLAARGVTKVHVRRLSHRLPEIMDECERHNMPHVYTLREFVGHTYEMNKDFDFRYPSGYRLSMPRPQECAPVARALAEAIKQFVELAEISSQIYFASETSQFRGKKIRWSD